MTDAARLLHLVSEISLIASTMRRFIPFFIAALCFYVTGCGSVPGVSGGSSGPSFWERVKEASESIRRKYQKPPAPTAVVRMNFFIEEPAEEGLILPYASNVSPDDVTAFVSVGASRVATDLGFMQYSLSSDLFLVKSPSDSKLARVALSYVKLIESGVTRFEDAGELQKMLFQVDPRAGNDYAYRIDATGFVATSVDVRTPHRLNFDAELSFTLFRRVKDSSSEPTPVTRVKQEKLDAFNAELQKRLLQTYVTYLSDYRINIHIKQ